MLVTSLAAACLERPKLKEARLRLRSLFFYFSMPLVSKKPSLGADFSEHFHNFEVSFYQHFAAVLTFFPENWLVVWITS